MQTSKIILAKEVIEAMQFLGIPTEKFSELKQQYGSLQALHAAMESQLS